MSREGLHGNLRAVRKRSDATCGWFCTMQQGRLFTSRQAQGCAREKASKKAANYTKTESISKVYSRGCRSSTWPKVCGQHSSNGL